MTSFLYVWVIFILLCRFGVPQEDDYDSLAYEDYMAYYEAYASYDGYEEVEPPKENNPRSLKSASGVKHADKVVEDEPDPIALQNRRLARSGYAPIGRPREFRDPSLGPVVTNTFTDSISRSTRCIPRGETAEEAILSAAAAALSEQEDGGDGEEGAISEEESQFDGSSSKLKRSYKEMQRQKQIEREEAARKLLEKQKHRVLLGPDCSSLRCSACRISVREFGSALLRQKSNEEYIFIDDVAATFCDSRELHLVGDSSVLDMCSVLFNPYHRDTILSYFDELVSNKQFGDLEKYKPSSVALEVDICRAAGACDLEDVSLITEPTSERQQTWEEDCFLCNFFARQLESELRLFPLVNERIAGSVTRTICGSLQLPESSQTTCASMTQGRSLDDISWAAAMHYENMKKVKSARLSFPDQMCIDIKMCTPQEEEEEEEQQQEIFQYD